MILIYQCLRAHSCSEEARRGVRKLHNEKAGWTLAHQAARMLERLDKLANKWSQNEDAPSIRPPSRLCQSAARAARAVVGDAMSHVRVPLGERLPAPRPEIPLEDGLLGPYGDYVVFYDGAARKLEGR